MRTWLVLNPEGAFLAILQETGGKKPNTWAAGCNLPMNFPLAFRSRETSIMELSLQTILIMY